MRHRRPHCGCRPKQVVHPVKENVVHCCSEEVVNHIHPSHTTVMNHHLVKNVHEFPHSTSVANTFNEVDVLGPAYNTPRPPMGAPTSVAGAMSPPYGPGMAGPGMGGQVAGATSPGMQMGYGPGQVAGATSPGMNMPYGPGQVAGAQHWNKGNKWC